MRSRLQIFLENEWEILERELEERLSPTEKLKKQVKNFGVELEWASHMSEEEYEDMIVELVKKHFGDNYGVKLEGDTSGIERNFILTSDSSANFESDSESTIETISQEIANEMGSYYESKYNDLREEAEGQVEEDDYMDGDGNLDEDAWEEAVMEEYDRLYNDFTEEFFSDLMGYLNSRGLDGQNIVRKMLRVHTFEDFSKRETYNILFDHFVSNPEDLEIDDTESYNYGVELVSPRLAFHESNIDRICDLFEDISQLPDLKFHQNAGLHVHIGKADGMSIIHFLRMALYVYRNSESVQELAGREFNRWAADSEDVISNLESLISMNTTDVEDKFTDYLQSSLSSLARERYRAVNVSALTKGTVEFRLGSSEIAGEYNKLHAFLSFLKEVFDYGVSEDYYEDRLSGNRLMIGDKTGRWKVTDDIGNVVISSKNNKLDLNRITSSENDMKTERLWKHITKKFNNNETFKEKLAQRVKKHFLEVLSYRSLDQKIYFDQMNEYLNQYLQDKSFQSLENLINYLVDFDLSFTKEDVIKLISKKGVKK